MKEESDGEEESDGVVDDEAAVELLTVVGIIEYWVTVTQRVSTIVEVE